MDYAQAVVELYQVAHARFVAERKRLSGELRAAGNKLGAQRLIAIQRPPISTWVVNQLWWQARDEVEAMFAAADRVRAGDRAAGQTLREAVAMLRERAAGLLEAGGHGASETTLRRVQVTLDALAALGSWDPDPPGCLADDRDPPGFEAMAAIAAAAPAPLKPIGAAVGAAIAPRAPAPSARDHEDALRSLDEDDGGGDDDDAVDEEAAAAAEQARKFAAAQAAVQKQRELAAKAQANAAALIAARAAATPAPVEVEEEEEEEEDDADADEASDTLATTDEQARKFAAAQAAVQKQREAAAKAAATVAAAKAARGGAPPAKLAESTRVEMQRRAAEVTQAARIAAIATPPAPPPAATPARPAADARKLAERERLLVEVKRARSELHARERAVLRLRAQLETAEIAVVTAEATLTAYETKLRAVDPSYEPPEREPAELDEDDA